MSNNKLFLRPTCIHVYIYTSKYTSLHHSGTAGTFSSLTYEMKGAQSVNFFVNPFSVCLIFSNFKHLKTYLIQ